MQTTDPQDELFDIVDEHGKPLGYSKRRDEVHRDGDWHRSLHLWIWGIQDDMPFVLFQRRSPTKDTFPNLLDVSVGGHLRAGETLDETVREAQEELGLDLELDDLTRLGTCFHSSAGPTFIDQEVMAVFAYRCDQPLDAYTLHPEELSGLVRISIEGAQAIFKSDAGSAAVEEWDGQSAPARRTVRRSDFVDSGEYAGTVLDALSVRWRGETPEPFEVRTQLRRA